MKLLHETSTVETPEQLEIALPLAGVGSRFLAYLVDLLCQLIPLVLALVLVIVSLPLGAKDYLQNGPTGPTVNLLALALLSAVLFAINFCYFALFETFWHGQSPGKRALHLRVVRDGGYPIDGRAALIRNLLRTVDVLPAFYAIGVIALFLGRQGKRIGDYAAGTIVIKEDVAAQPAESNVSPVKIEAGLAPAEAALVEQFLSRMLDLEPDPRDRLAKEMAHRLAQRYGKPVPDDPLKFLASLVKHDS